jgi:3-phenylpropionate/trans-cinnamate dioxygenase ferredoxin subunit
MAWTLPLDFDEVVPLDQLPPGTGSVFTVAGRDVAVFNVGGKVCAIGDACPHAGASLGMGRLDGGIVTCRQHGMKIDVTTGCFAGTPDFAVDSYAVKVENGIVLVAHGETRK